MENDIEVDAVGMGTADRRWSSESDRSSSSRSSSDLSEGFTEIITGGTRAILNTGVSGANVLIVGSSNVHVRDGHVTIVQPSEVVDVTRHRDVSPFHHGRSSTQQTHTRDEELPISSSTEKLANQELNHVCQEIGKAWMKLGRELGLTKGELECVELDYKSEGTYEIAWQTLLKWRGKRARDANKHTLTKALCKVGRKDIAKRIL